MTASVLAEPSKVVQKRSGLVGHYGEAIFGDSLAYHAGPAFANAALAGPAYAGPAVAHAIGGPGVVAGPGFGGPVVAGPLGAGLVANGLASSAIIGANVHTTVTKHVGYPVPAPYPVAVDRPVPYPVRVSFFNIMFLLKTSFNLRKLLLTLRTKPKSIL